MTQKKDPYNNNQLQLPYYLDYDGFIKFDPNIVNQVPIVRLNTHKLYNIYNQGPCLVNDLESLDLCPNNPVKPTSILLTVYQNLLREVNLLLPPDIYILT